MTDRQTHITPVPRLASEIQESAQDLEIWLEQFQKSVDIDISNIDYLKNLGINFYGAVGDGVFDNSDSISTAISTDDYIYTKHGETYYSTSTNYFNSYTSNIHGRGVIQYNTLGTTYNLPFEHRYISARPSDVSTLTNSYLNAFN